MAEKRGDDEKKEETEDKKNKFKIRKEKKEESTLSEVSEGGFSDEIRSRGRSEFGYLIHERG